MKKLFTAIIGFCALGGTAIAQTSATATVSATIVEPITISRNVESYFGNGTVILYGEVTLSPVGIHSTAGSVNLPASTGTFTASFIQSGTAGYNCSITVPPSPLTFYAGTKKMKVNSMTGDFPSQNSQSGLAAGFYIAVTPFNVTMNYN
jgi:hypothetical protein